jgi:hypothetical protein
MAEEACSACLQTLAFRDCAWLKKTFCSSSRGGFGHLCEHAGATRLDSLDLGCGPRGSGKAGRQVAAVEELSGCRLDRPKRLSGLAANEAAVLAGGDLAVQRTMLRGLLSVGSERLGKVGGRSGGVSVRSVINLCACVRRGD